MQVAFGRGLAPIAVSVFEAMQGRGKDVVEGIQVLRAAQGSAVEKTGKLRQLAQRLGFHGL